jgi:hypothetical protein
MDYIFIVLIIIIIFLASRSPCMQKKENYVNMYGDYIDSPFFEDDDRACRRTCQNMSDCKGYTYDQTTGKCYLNSDREEYLSPFSDHFIYPWFDTYLYDNAWYLYGSRPSPKVYSEEKALLPEDDGPKPPEAQGRVTTNTIPPWTPEDYFARGYRNNTYMGKSVHHYTNKRLSKSKYNGSVNGLLGGGHGGRVRGNHPGKNEIEYQKL